MYYVNFLLLFPKMRKCNGSSQAAVGLRTALCTLRALQPGSLDAFNTIMKAHIAGQPGNLLLATLGEPVGTSPSLTGCFGELGF